MRERTREREQRGLRLQRRGFFQGCLTEILGVFLASWSIEKDNRGNKHLQVSLR